MDHQAGRLVDDEQVFVPVNDVQGNILGQPFGGLLGRNTDLQRIARQQLLLGLQLPARTNHAAGANPALDGGPGIAGQQSGQGLVHAQAFKVVRNGNLQLRAGVVIQDVGAAAVHAREGCTMAKSGVIAPHCTTTAEFPSESMMPIAKTVLLSLVMLALAGCAMFKKEEIDENATVEELYALATVSMEKGNWGDAVERLRMLEAKYPYGTYAEQAQLDTIYAYFRNSEPGLAIAAADRFIKLHPTHASVDYAYFLKGQASYEEDQSTIGVLLGKDDLSDRDPTLTLNALNAFKDVYTLFPDSKYAPVARERVQYLTNTLAKHELAIARYYFARDAYVAAVNRAKGIVEDYPDTATVEEALGLLIACYRTMNLPGLADDSRRVLALNFPDSPYLADDVEFEGARYTDAGQKSAGDNKGFLSSIRNFFRRKPAG